MSAPAARVRALAIAVLAAGYGAVVEGQEHGAPVPAGTATAATVGTATTQPKSAVASPRAAASQAARTPAAPKSGAAPPPARPAATPRGTGARPSVLDSIVDVMPTRGRVAGAVVAPPKPVLGRGPTRTVPAPTASVHAHPAVAPATAEIPASSAAAAGEIIAAALKASAAVRRPGATGSARPGRTVEPRPGAATSDRRADRTPVPPAPPAYEVVWTAKPVPVRWPEPPDHVHLTWPEEHRTINLRWP